MFLLGPSMPKNLSVTSSDFHLTNYQLAPSQITSPTTNKTILKNLEALHKAREAFIASENSEKLKRALSQNIRTSVDIKYLTGDSYDI